MKKLMIIMGLMLFAPFCFAQHGGAGSDPNSAIAPYDPTLDTFLLNPQNLYDPQAVGKLNRDLENINLKNKNADDTEANRRRIIQIIAAINGLLHPAPAPAPVAPVPQKPNASGAFQFLGGTFTPGRH